MSAAPAVRAAGLFERDENGVAYLRGSCCEHCAEHVFPSRVICPRCRLSTMRPARLGPEGTLFSFTVSHVAPEGFDAPYLQAFVQLSEGPRVFSLISDEIEPRLDALELGQPMELVIEPKTAARTELIYKFRPRPDATSA